MWLDGKQLHLLWKKTNKFNQQLELWRNEIKKGIKTLFKLQKKSIGGVMCKIT